jgi:hypothetical protein
MLFSFFRDFLDTLSEFLAFDSLEIDYFLIWSADLVVTPAASSSTFLSLSASLENLPSLTLNLTIFISCLDF